MNDDELRSLIRAAIQRHMGESTRTVRLQADDQAALQLKPDSVVSLSFGQYRLERSAGDTSCIIEPAVQCHHCGFCKCHGH